MVNCLDRKERRKRQLAEEEQEQHKKARTREKIRELERFKKSNSYLDQVLILFLLLFFVVFVKARYSYFRANELVCFDGIFLN